MTIQQLAQRLIDLEQQVAELKRDGKPLGPVPDAKDTFGMFADDPDFDETVRLGREYREHADSEGNAC